jgi:hypothetical protein
VAQIAPIMNQKQREASDTEAGTKFRLKKINEGLASNDVRQLALQRLEQFLSMDGDPRWEESTFLALVKQNVKA